MEQQAVAYSEILMTKDEETLLCYISLDVFCLVFYVAVAFLTRICPSLSFPEVYLSRYCMVVFMKVFVDYIFFIGYQFTLETAFREKNQTFLFSGVLTSYCCERLYKIDF